MNKKTVYFHIGHSKCGSSTIQSFCDLNREQLLADDYCYPNIPDNKRWHAQISPSFYKAAGVDDRSPTYVRHALQAIKESSANNIILSSESFYEDDISLFEAFNEFNLKFVYYIRLQEYFIESSSNQAIKQGNLNAIYQLSQPFRKNYYLETLDKISARFGDDAIIVRLFDSSSFVDDDLTQDFLHIIGLKNRKNYSFSTIENASLKGNLIKYAAKLALVPLSPMERLEAMDEMSHLSCDTGESINLLLEKERERIRSFCSQTNKEISSRFLSNYNKTQIKAFCIDGKEDGIFLGCLPIIQKIKKQKMFKAKLAQLMLSPDDEKYIFSQLSKELRGLIIARSVFKSTYDRSIQMPYISLPDFPKDAESYIVSQLKRDQAVTTREFQSLAGRFKRFTSPILLECYLGHNLVIFKDFFYGIPSRLHVDWEDPSSYAMNPLIVRAFSIEELKTTISAIGIAQQ